MKKETKLKFTVGIIIVLATILVYTIFVHKNNEKADLPTVSAGIQVDEVHTNSIRLTWIVKNRSDQVLTFDKNRIMQITLNGKEIVYPTKPAKLGPGEQVNIDVDIKDINVEQTNTVKITATSNEGTEVTIVQNISKAK